MDIIFNAHEQTAYGAAQAKAEDKARAAEFAALSNPLVLAARAFEKDGKTVLAVLTEPIYLASDRAKLKELLTAEASAAAGSPVTLTFDLDVYRSHLRPRRLPPHLPRHERRGESIHIEKTRDMIGRAPMPSSTS